MTDEAEEQAPVEEPVPEPTPEPVQEPEPVLEPEPSPSPVEEDEKKEDVKYTVKPGDWLSRIAIKYNKDWRALAEFNKIKNPDLIFPGQIIVIPQ